MQCPNCHLEQPDLSETCPGCGLIFAKWRERHPEAAAPVTAAPEGTSSENATRDPAAPPESTLPPPASTRSPLLEREYHEFPVKKFAWIFGIALVGVGIFSFFYVKPNEYVAKPIPHPTSVMGSLYEGTVYPTETAWPTTPTPTAIPMTIAGDPWVFHGKVVDCLHLAPVGGVTIIFTNNGVAVTAVSDGGGLYQLSAPPLSGDEAYEVQVLHSNFRQGYWLDDSSSLTEQERLARYYDFQEQNSHLRGISGVEKHMDFSLYPERLTEQESMWVQNARPQQNQ